jgi:F-type H+-transporting ATPase subunit gamma
MANMREIKLRIKSIKEERQITKAMKLIAAAKLKKARQQLEQTTPYFKKVKTTIADILIHSSSIRSDENTFFDTRSDKEEKKSGFIILTGDKGLAGGYNHNVIKLAESVIKDSKNPLLFIAGHVGRNYFFRKNANIFQDFDYPVQNPSVYRAREVSDIILNLFRHGELDEVYLVYTDMVSAIKLVPTVIKLLPLSLDDLKEDLGVDESSQVKLDDMINYEPSPKAVFDVLIPKYVKGIVYGAFVEAFTSEQSARMTAMDNATANADDMLQALNLYYNRARQATITQEISEIVGGAAALQ